MSWLPLDSGSSSFDMSTPSRSGEKSDHEIPAEWRDSFSSSCPTERILGNEETPLSEKEPLQQTIETMELGHACYHPLHYHSFAQVMFLISGPMRNCVGCQQRLRSVFGPGGEVNAQVLRCLACGSYAHRRCAMKNDETMWATKCPVNYKEPISDKSTKQLSNPNSQGAQKKEQTPNGINESGQNELAERLNVFAESRFPPVSAFGSQTVSDFEASGEFVTRDQEVVNENGHHPASKVSSSSSLLSNVFAKVWYRKRGLDDEPESETPDKTAQGEEDEDEMRWTEEGPPKHWASEKELNDISSLVEDAAESAIDQPSTMHIANSSFGSVSRTLQENILARFNHKERSRRRLLDHQRDEDNDYETVSGTELGDDDVVSIQVGEADALIPPADQVSSTTRHDNSQPVDPKMLLKEVDPDMVTKDKRALWKVAGSGYDAAKTSASLRKKIGIVSVAGGIAGGVAGLVLAGPGGAVIGAKCGQAAGVFSVIIEGGLTISVFVASAAAAAGFTAHQLHRHQQKRVLAIGEDGVERKVLLVRPNISIDPVWEGICEGAKRNAPSRSSNFFNVLTASPAKQAELEREERSKKDTDIVFAGEDELPTIDKVLLLVSRHLNSKLSLPGHVYRRLIDEYRKRDEFRKYKAALLQYNGGEIQSIEEEKVTAEEEPGKEMKYRARRQDAHAVIKHVTATLLEVRPGFASSPKITEMSATAVEGLVFGEIYDSVMEEIREETADADYTLMRKILAFDKDHPGPADISSAAIDSIKLVPEAHSAADKLRYCVQFLAAISEHFEDRNISADNLLKMVCQHIIVAKVADINAEVAFLEEFARDEQLLRGREGYALVTLQASLHFLNNSDDFDTDIFYDDEEDCD